MTRDTGAKSRRGQRCADGAPGFGPRRVPLRPISVWGTEYLTAREYAPAVQPGQVLCAVVPAARILSTFRTGPGWSQAGLLPRSGAVWLVGGARDRAWCLTWPTPGAPESGWTEAQYRAAAAATRQG